MFLLFLCWNFMKNRTSRKMWHHHILRALLVCGLTIILLVGG